MYTIDCGYFAAKLIIEKIISGSCEHLNNHIFKEVSEIGGEFIVEDLFIDHILGGIVILKH